MSCGDDVRFELQNKPLPRRANGKLAPPEMLVTVPDYEERMQAISDKGHGCSTPLDLIRILQPNFHVIRSTRKILAALTWWPYEREDLFRTLDADAANLFRLAHLLATERLLQKDSICAQNTMAYAAVVLDAIKTWIRSPSKPGLEIALGGNKCCYSQQLDYYRMFMNILRKWAIRKKQRMDVCAKVSIEELD